MNARTKTVAAAVAAAMMAVTLPLFAADSPTTGATPKSEPIYGYRMMTPEERDQYREQMRNARSPEERQTVRDEHHKAMTERAKERGVTLPEPRGPRSGAGGPGGRGGMGPGSGMGPGAGMGPGYGPGNGGMGPGYGRGPGAGRGGGCPAGQNCAQQDGAPAK